MALLFNNDQIHLKYYYQSTLLTHLLWVVSGATLVCMAACWCLWRIGWWLKE
ncbi:MAG: hypothetical protein Q9M27_06040 [Mariprofundaceae bacterium]|nr:hypothetical protein [Mariprofundaceae bacterium]